MDRKDYYEYHESKQELALGQLDEPLPRGHCNVDYKAECERGWENVCCALSCEVRCGAACDANPETCGFGEVE